MVSRGFGRSRIDRISRPLSSRTSSTSPCSYSTVRIAMPAGYAQGRVGVKRKVAETRRSELDGEHVVVPEGDDELAHDHVLVLRVVRALVVLGDVAVVQHLPLEPGQL